MDLQQVEQQMDCDVATLLAMTGRVTRIVEKTLVVWIATSLRSSQ